MADIPEYPKELPMPLLLDAKTRHKSPLKRSDFISGRSRQRRRFRNTSSVKDVVFRMTEPQTAYFETWYQNTITDGAVWFMIRLRTPIGTKLYKCRFWDIYEGPDEVGFLAYEIRAKLELEKRPVLPPEDLLFPDEILYASLFDYTMNEHWPES